MMNRQKTEPSPAAQTAEAASPADGAVWYSECASMHHTKQGYVFESDETDQQICGGLHGTMNRILHTNPYQPGSGTALYLTACCKKAYLVVQSQADTAEERSTCRLNCFRIHRGALLGGHALTPREQVECSRLLRHVLRQDLPAEHDSRMTLFAVMRAYTTLAELLPACVETRLLLRLRMDSESPAPETPAEPADPVYLRLFAVLLDAACRNGLSQAAVIRADSLAQQLLRMADTSAAEQLFSFSAEDTELLADASDGISRVLPEYTGSMEMLCVLNGTRPRAGKQLPAPDPYVRAYLMMTRCTAEKAVQLEELLRKYRDLALSAGTRRLVGVFLDLFQKQDSLDPERLHAALEGQGVCFDSAAAARLFWLQIPCMTDQTGSDR